MTKTKLKAYTDLKYFSFSKYNIVLCILIFLVFLISIKKYFKIDENLSFFLIVLTFFYFTFTLISTHFRTEHINGKYFGELFFKNNEITIGENKYLIKDIQKIEITNLDIKGKYIIRVGRTFSPKKSNGIKNNLKIFLIDGATKEVNFLQTKDQQVKVFKEEFISYYEQKIISWQNLTWIVDVEKENITT
jgi:hypothetical protein